MVNYLTTEEVLTIHAEIIETYGGLDGIRDLTLLESAVARPRAGFGEFEAYPTVLGKGAVLLHLLIKNHPFVDGNKRTGSVAMIIFLERNGLELHASNRQLVQLALKVAAGRLDESSITAWLEANSRPINR